MHKGQGTRNKWGNTINNWEMNSKQLGEKKVVKFKDVWNGEDCSKVQMFKVERWGKEKGWMFRVA